MGRVDLRMETRLKRLPYNFYKYASIITELGYSIVIPDLDT